MRRRMVGSEDAKIRYLKSVGCVLWFPFNDRYRYNSAIGKTSIRVVRYIGDGSMTYKADLDMVEFYLGDNNAIICSFPTNWAQDKFPNDEWTLFSQSIRYPNESNRGSCNIFRFPTEGDNYNFFQQCVNRNVSSNQQTWTNDELQSTFVLIDKPNTNRQLYHASESETLSMIREDTTVNIYGTPYAQDTISTISYGSATRYKKFVLRNMMIFNRRLTEQEMQKVLDIL